MIRHMSGLSCPHRPCHMKRPSRLTTHSWIFEEDAAKNKPACTVCPHPQWKVGQWMMFFDSSIIDEKWDLVVDCYRRGLLFGVQSIKVSTAKETFKCSDMPGMKCHVIIFYCGPSDHKDLMMKIGHNLLCYIDYKNFHNSETFTPLGAMFYTDSFKFNEDKDVTFKYRITLPRYCNCMMCRKA